MCHVFVGHCPPGTVVALGSLSPFYRARAADSDPRQDIAGLWLVLHLSVIFPKITSNAAVLFIGQVSVDSKKILQRPCEFPILIRQLP